MALKRLKLKSRIDERLAEMGKPQAWLARHLGMGPSYISRVAKGVTIPRVTTAYIIAAALHCTIEDLWEPMS